MGVQLARIGVQVTRMKSNALFLKPEYLFRYLRKGYVSQENYDALIKRSPQTQPQRRIKHPENQRQHQDQCWQYPAAIKAGGVAGVVLAAAGRSG